MKAFLRSVTLAPREIVEDLFLFVLPFTWRRRYLNWRLQRCDPDRTQRRILILTKMILSSERGGDLGAAEAAARSILSIDPHDVAVPVELASILEQQGRISEAKELYQRISAAPSASAAYRARALLEVERLTKLEGE